MAKSSEARKHHVTPKCWLAGFTPSGHKEDLLFVTDLSRNKQRADKPANVGYIRDFYRVGDHDPLKWEKTFGEIESRIAPLLKRLFTEHHEPQGEDLTDLLAFGAVQFIRIPLFRPLIRRAAETTYRQLISRLVDRPAYFRRTMKRAKFLPESLSHEQLANFQKNVMETGAFDVKIDTEFFVHRGFLSLPRLVSQLEKRYWQCLVSPTGSFIGSDNPVVLDGPRECQIGFGTAEIIQFPLNRFLLLRGTLSPAFREPVTRRTIAGVNTFTLLNAQEYIYSVVPDFPWLNEHDRVSYDWTEFSKIALLEQIKSNEQFGMTVRTYGGEARKQT